MQFFSFSGSGVIVKISLEVGENGASSQSKMLAFTEPTY